MEGRARWAEFRSGDVHGVEGVDIEDVEAAASVHQHLGEALLGCRLLVVSFFRPAGLSQEMLEELVVLVEVLDRVGVIGAWTLHELVEVVRLALLDCLPA